MFERLLGIEMKREQYAAGRAFCDSVVELTDEATLTRMWDSAERCRPCPRSASRASGWPAASDPSSGGSGDPGTQPLCRATFDLAQAGTPNPPRTSGGTMRSRVLVTVVATLVGLLAASSGAGARARSTTWIPGASRRCRARVPVNFVFVGYSRARCRGRASCPGLGDPPAGAVQDVLRPAVGPEHRLRTTTTSPTRTPRSRTASSARCPGSPTRRRSRSTSSTTTRRPTCWTWRRTTTSTRRAWSGG